MLNSWERGNQITYSRFDDYWGDPTTLGGKATPAMCEDFNRRFGLDRPLPARFMLYVGNILRGDPGESIRFERPIHYGDAQRTPAHDGGAKCFGHDSRHASKSRQK